MRVTMLVKRKTPEFPRVIRISDSDKVVFISRIYTEPPANDESPGWSDWTEAQKYYKYKYTPPLGQRIVFIIPKTTELSIDEFSKAIKGTRWFKALKKWATTGFDEFEADHRLTDQLTEKLYPLLTKREIWCCGESIRKWLSEIPEMMRRLEGLETVDSTGVYYRFRREFDCGPRCVLPFTVQVDITMTWDEFSERIPIYSLIRDYLRLILEIMEKVERFIDFTKIPEKRENLTKYLGEVIERLREKGNLRIDFMEKIVLWLRYQKHFGTTYLD